MSAKAGRCVRLGAGHRMHHGGPNSTQVLPRYLARVHAMAPVSKGTGQLASFDVMGFLKRTAGMAVATYRENQIVYAQGDLADSVFYIYSGKVKVAVVSEHGREAVVAVRGPDEF